jgi:hypothetical protein
MSLEFVIVGAVFTAFSGYMLRKSLLDFRDRPEKRLYYFLDFLFLGYGVFWVFAIMVGVLFVLYGFGLVNG